MSLKFFTNCTKHFLCLINHHKRRRIDGGSMGPRILRLSARWPWGNSRMPGQFISPVPIGGARSHSGGGAEREATAPLVTRFLRCRVNRRITIANEKARHLFKFYYVSFQLRLEQTNKSPSSLEQLSSIVIAAPSIRVFENSVWMLCNWAVECSSIRIVSWRPHQ